MPSPSDFPRSVTRTSIQGLLAALALGTSVLATSGCIEDPDCGICDPDDLVLTSISGNNYTLTKIHIVSPECEGDDCPEPFEKANYFVDTIELCENTEASAESARPGDEGYCLIAPIAIRSGLEFVFNNLLEATSLELVRKDPSNPQLFQVYDWKTEILRIEGPITRFNGDVFLGASEQPDIITRYVNLSCVDNLRLKGQSFSHEDYEDPDTNPCNQLDPDTGLPMKMWTQVEPPPGFPPAVTKSYEGEWDTRSQERSCDTPTSGPDTCCSACDFETTVNVAKYGVMPGSDVWRNPNTGTAITCDPMGNKFEDCADFEPWTNREREVRTYTYAWSSPDVRETFKIPVYDKLRETHPDERPQFVEDRSAAPACATTSDCRDIHNLPGTECVGVKDSGGQQVSCSMNDPDCTEGRCLAEWFVTCRADNNTTGGDVGYCVDKRFNPFAAGACYQATAEFPLVDPDTGEVTGQTASAGSLLVACDTNENNELSAQECCLAALGSAGDQEACDPVFQANVRPVSLYTRNSNLPTEARTCICRSDYEEAYPGDEGRTCREMVERLCLDDNGNMRPERDGDYAIKWVTKRGGVVYDPAIKGFDYRPAHIGNMQRARIEACAEGASRIGARNVRDGWRLNDPFVPHAFEDFDRAICSGQEYTIVFNDKNDTKLGLDENGNPVEVDAENVEDKVGNDLSGKKRYHIRTSQFHIVPDSGFPFTALRIGACDSFSINFSNKYDMSPENLAKIRLVELPLDENGDPVTDVDPSTLPVVAGGPNCAKDQAEKEADPSKPPCLTVDVGDQWLGRVRVLVDTSKFTEPALETGKWYRMWIPYLESIDEMNDPVKYREAFWDVCGMPLVAGPVGSPQFRESLYDFLIDPPKCEEDKDFDGIPFSCDNADDFYNPGQENADGDAFGDVEDLCPLVPNTNNMGDSDRDGVGNDCDNCRKTTTQYNTDAANAIKPYLWVRNVPFQHDTDQDGIGDVCDNCVTVANCEDYGPSNPYGVGDPIDVDNTNLCQRDDDENMIGNDCEGLQEPNAAGPVGFGDDDDFDQDGIRNIEDACPRQPVTTEGPIVNCASDDDCPTSRPCTSAGICGHADEDGDQVGDMCDTCPYNVNPLQVMDGGAQEDDPDGDFVGEPCEAGDCSKNPRPFSFHQVSVSGFCCVTTYPAGGPCTTDEECGFGQMCDLGVNGGTCALKDPDGIPVRTDPATCSEAQEEAGECRLLPAAVRDAPGILQLPPGCEEALMDAGITEEENSRVLTEEDFGGDLDALWATQCFLPQWDQDFDGIGDLCDLCPFAYDPTNAVFVDENGKVWTNRGKFCWGDYDINKVCDQGMGETGTGTGGTGGTGGTTGGTTGG